MSAGPSNRFRSTPAGLAWDTLSDRIDPAPLELAEAIIAAHKAAVRNDDQMALALLEPLLRHAGGRLLTECAKPAPDELSGWCGETDVDGQPTKN